MNPHSHLGTPLILSFIGPFCKRIAKPLAFIALRSSVRCSSRPRGVSVFWTVAALFLAAFGAGPLSVARTLLKREF